MLPPTAPRLLPQRAACLVCRKGAQRHAVPLHEVSNEGPLLGFFAFGWEQAYSLAAWEMKDFLGGCNLLPTLSGPTLWVTVWHPRGLGNDQNSGSQLSQALAVWSRPSSGGGPL